MTVNKERLMSFVDETSPKYLIVLYMVLLLALGLFAASVVLLPQEMRAAALAQTLQTEKQKVAIVETFVLAHPDTDQYLTELQKALTRAETALPSAVDSSIFLSQLEKDARAAGVKLTAVKPSAVADRVGYREMPVEVSVEGTFFATLSFLKKMEDGERFSLPAAFLIQQKKDLLATKLNLQIFSYGITPRPAVTAPGSPAGKSPAAR